MLPKPSPTPPGAAFGSATVVERVAAFSKKAPAVDHFTGKKVCHVYHVGLPFFKEVSKLSPPEPAGHVVNFKCMGAACSLWNDEAKECFDVTKARAEIRTADALEYIGAAHAMGNMGGGE